MNQTVKKNDRSMSSCTTWAFKDTVESICNLIEQILMQGKAPSELNMATTEGGWKAVGKRCGLGQSVGRGGLTGSRRLWKQNDSRGVVNGREVSSTGKEGNWKRVHNICVGF